MIKKIFFIVCAFVCTASFASDFQKTDDDASLMKYKIDNLHARQDHPDSRKVYIRFAIMLMNNWNKSQNDYFLKRFNELLKDKKIYADDSSFHTKTPLIEIAKDRAAKDAGRKAFVDILQKELDGYALNSKK